MRTQLLGNLVVGLSSGLAAVLLTLTLQAGAVGTNIPDTVAYSGYLDLDGGPYDGMLDVSLHAYADEADDVAVYTWDLTDVRFSAGRFSVVLPLDDESGQPNAAGALVRADPTVYIGVDLHYGDAVVSLQGRQRLQAVPYAVSARHSADFDVDGDLRVGGAVTFDQPLDIDQLGAASVGSDQLVDAAVITDKVDALAITTDKLADGAVTTAKVADDAITIAQIGTDAVGLDELVGDELPIYRGGPYCYKSERDTLTLSASAKCTSRQQSTCSINIDGNTVPAARYLRCDGSVDPCQLFNTPDECTVILAGYIASPDASPAEAPPAEAPSAP